MLLLDFDDGQLVNRSYTSFLFLPLPFSCLLRHPSYHLEYTVIWVKIGIIICHKLAWICSMLHLHSLELMTAEQVLKACKHLINSSS
jgi:hypothetical protein